MIKEQIAFDNSKLKENLALIYFQKKNYEQALKVLKARLLDKAQREQNDSITSQRRKLVSSGDRSAKIRTYNFPQGSVSDHRINLTLYKLDKVLEGEIDDFVKQLHIADRDLQFEEEHE